MSDTFSLVDATMKVIQDRRSIRDTRPKRVAPGSGHVLEAAPTGAIGRKCPAWPS